MLSVPWLTLKAISAIFSTASCVKINLIPSALRSAMYCFKSEFSGSFKILTKSSLDNAFNSTRIGKRPCSSGIKSLGLDSANAPAAIKRM